MDDEDVEGFGKTTDGAPFRVMPLIVIPLDVSFALSLDRATETSLFNGKVDDFFVSEKC